MSRLGLQLFLLSNYFLSSAGPEYLCVWLVNELVNTLSLDLQLLNLLELLVKLLLRRVNIFLNDFEFLL